MHAWSGCGFIEKVEVSDDGGESWMPADLVGPRDKYTWQQWNLTWEPTAPGHYALMVRAKDEHGNLQPMEPRWNRLGYVINGVQKVCFNVGD